MGIDPTAVAAANLPAGQQFTRFVHQTNSGLGLGGEPLPSVATTFADAKYADGTEANTGINELRLRRSRFEEVRDAFIALQRAIELGYMVVE